MRIATYTRISTDEATQPYSLEAQAARLDSYVDSQEDWRIVRRFTDQASGAILERPGLERALERGRGRSLRPAARLPRRPPLALGARAGPDPRAPRRRRGALPLGDRALRHRQLGRADDGAAPRRLRRVRAGDDRRAHRRRDGTQGRTRRVGRRQHPLRLPARCRPPLPRSRAEPRRRSSRRSSTATPSGSKAPRRLPSG